jgi:hypothetical protein
MLSHSLVVQIAVNFTVLSTAQASPQIENNFNSDPHLLLLLHDNL